MSEKTLVKLIGEIGRLVPRPPRPDPLPRGTPWQGVVVARITTYIAWCIGWAGAIAVVLWAAAAAAAKVSGS